MFILILQSLLLYFRKQTDTLLLLLETISQGFPQNYLMGDMTMNLNCNIITAVISMAIISAFAASLSVSISAYGVSKNSSDDIQVRIIHLV